MRRLLEAHAVGRFDSGRYLNDLMSVGSVDNNRDPLHVAFRREIAQRVRQRRKELGMSQHQLAQILGFSDGTITKFEAGHVPWDQISAIAEALDVSPRWILHGDRALEEELALLGEQVAELRRLILQVLPAGGREAETG